LSLRFFCFDRARVRGGNLRYHWAMVLAFLLAVGFTVCGRGYVRSDLRAFLAVFGWFITSLVLFCSK